MAEKIAIIYDLKKKSNSERTQIIRKLYGYRDISNYDYSYQREGLLDKIEMIRAKKTVLYLQDKKDLAKVAEILKKLKVEFELAKI